MYRRCTGNNDYSSIEQILSRAPFFEEIKTGTNECYLYEGYISNLLDLVRYIKSLGAEYPIELDKITPDVIAAVNRTQREVFDIVRANKIENEEFAIKTIGGVLVSDEGVRKFKLNSNIKKKSDKVLYSGMINRGKKVVKAKRISGARVNKGENVGKSHKRVKVIY